MPHTLSHEDLGFRAAFESGAIAPADFSHRAHVRLAYIYLAEGDAENASRRMRSAITAFLQHHGITASKYHETLTQAWILAVDHFMHRSPSASCANDFIERNPPLLDSKIMLTHYSAEMLFSAKAREEFVEPDVDPIPRHAV